MKELNITEVYDLYKKNIIRIDFPQESFLYKTSKEILELDFEKRNRFFNNKLNYLDNNLTIEDELLYLNTYIPRRYNIDPSSNIINKVIDKVFNKTTLKLRQETFQTIQTYEKITINDSRLKFTITGLNNGIMPVNCFFTKYWTELLNSKGYLTQIYKNNILENDSQLFMIKFFYTSNRTY
jgi:hypothetical protein